MHELTLDIYIISRCTHSHYARELRKLGVTMGQFPFILGIAENDGISQEGLSSKLKISKSTTAVIVRQLLEAGIATRETDPEDRRNFRLHATAKAQKLVPRIYTAIDACHETITAGLTGVERSILAELARKVRINAETAMSGK